MILYSGVPVPLKRAPLPPAVLVGAVVGVSEYLGEAPGVGSWLCPAPTGEGFKRRCEVVAPVPPLSPAFWGALPTGPPVVHRQRRLVRPARPPRHAFFP